jgi:hypothetical protein
MTPVYLPEIREYAWSYGIYETFILSGKKRNQTIRSFSENSD